MTQAPGWYPDPEKPSQQRWWNGVSWSDDIVAADPPPTTQDPPPSAPAAPSAPATPRPYVTPNAPATPNTPATPELPTAPSVIDLAPQASGGAATPPLDDPFATPLRTITVWSWFIALSPVAAFVAYAALIAVGAVGEGWTPADLFLVFGFMVAILWLAAMDRWRLQQRGFVRPASILWNVLSPPVYLLARAASLRRGDGQRWVVFFCSLIVVALTIFAAPRFAAVVDAHDAAAVEDSIANDLNQQSGLHVNVSCPESLPEGLGEMFSCTVDPTGSGPMLTARVHWTDDHGNFAYTLRPAS